MKKLIIVLNLIIITTLFSCIKPSNEEYQTHCYDCTTTVIKYPKGATYWNNSNIEFNETIEYCNETLTQIRKTEKLTFTDSIADSTIIFTDLLGNNINIVKGDTITTRFETICRYKN
jgi:hypothetical protein